VSPNSKKGYSRVAVSGHLLQVPVSSPSIFAEKLGGVVINQFPQLEFPRYSGQLVKPMINSRRGNHGKTKKIYKGIQGISR
jgi:hypothetical protein